MCQAGLLDGLLHVVVPMLTRSSYSVETIHFAQETMIDNENHDR